MYSSSENELVTSRVPIHLVSYPRFNRYLVSCNGDQERALELYVANIRLSGAAMEAIHIVEVALRNAIDSELRVWNCARGGSSDWTSDPQGELRLLLEEGSHALAEAHRRARRAAPGKAPPRHDDIIPYLSLGSWYFLLPGGHRYRQAKDVLWEEAIAHAFPRRHQVPARAIKQTAHAIYDLRNRVAHLEPIYDLQLARRRSAMTRLLHMIDRHMKSWFTEVERFSEEISIFQHKWPTISPP